VRETDEGQDGSCDHVVPLRACGRIRRRDHGDGADERADKAPLSAIRPCAPNSARANDNQTPGAALSGRFHDAVLLNIGRNICAAGAP
jgi:hypothetical protein